MMIQTEQIEIDKIKIGARARKDFGDIEGLAKSITEVGLLQPILVTVFEKNYLLLDGHRRILAYKKLDRKSIPAYRFDPYNDNKEPHDITLSLQAEHDANAVRKDFTPSEAVWIADKIKSWIETKNRLEKDKQENQLKKQGANLALNDNATLEKKKGSESKKTRDEIAKSVGYGHTTLAKAKEVVESANLNPENADLVEKMDQTGKVDPVYQELKDREKGINKKEQAIPGTIASLTVRMPDGRQKKMGSISNEWFQNRNVLNWIIENVGLGVYEKDIIIHREGNKVQVFDSTNVEKLRQGVRYLIDRYTVQDSLIKEKDKGVLPD